MTSNRFSSPSNDSLRISTWAWHSRLELEAPAIKHVELCVSSSVSCPPVEHSHHCWQRLAWSALCWLYRAMKNSAVQQCSADQLERCQRHLVEVEGGNGCSHCARVNAAAAVMQIACYTVHIANADDCSLQQAAVEKKFWEICIKTRTTHCCMLLQVWLRLIRLENLIDLRHTGHLGVIKNREFSCSLLITNTTWVANSFANRQSMHKHKCPHGMHAMHALASRQTQQRGNASFLSLSDSTRYNLLYLSTFKWHLGHSSTSEQQSLQSTRCMQGTINMFAFFVHTWYKQWETNFQSWQFLECA